MAEPIRPVLRYFGGKWMLAPWIISHMPTHRIYVEPFGGGASVLLRKEPAYCEIYNDLDSEIVNFFRVLRDRTDELRKLIESTPFARAEYDLSFEPCDEPLEQARRTLVRSFFGISATALGRSNKPGFRSNSQANNTHIADTWATYASHLEAFRGRLQRVVIENKPALELIREQDSPDTLFLLDPPYVHASRTCRTGYGFEMDDQAHLSLCAELLRLQGKVILCGYDNEIYNSLGWMTVRQDAQTNGGGKQTEVLWLNPACVHASHQPSLFEGAHA